MSNNTNDYHEGFKAGRHALNRIVALKEDLAYEKGLLNGYTKSINLIRHLQRSDGRSHCNEEVREILTEAMELIAENIDEESEEEKSINQMKRSRE